MNKLKQFFRSLPEYYLFILAMIYAFWPPLDVHPFALFLVATFGLQLFFKNKISGVIIGLLFFMLNLYMILALIDEVAEFPVFVYEAKRLLFGGLAIIVFNLYMSGLLVAKSISQQKGSQGTFSDSVPV